jgi:crotonobetainyl-CoA:carnitine CoA-transferase CaiB-like acyl-CoA transferase
LCERRCLRPRRAIARRRRPRLALDLHSDPQLVDRDFFVELDHGGFGRSTFDGAVTLFSKTPAQPTRGGPLIGEHSFDVMRDVLGYSDEEISEIAAKGALS